MTTKYISKFGGGDCTAAQYITETLLHRQYSISKTQLLDKFWNTDEYRNRYKVLVIQVSKFINKHKLDQHILVTVILNNDRIFTVNKSKDKILTLYQLEVTKIKNLAKAEAITPDEQLKFIPTKKKSKLDNLRNE